MNNSPEHPMSIMMTALYQDHRDEVILPLLEDIENFDPENDQDIAPLLFISIDVCGVFAKEYAAEMQTTEANVNKWQSGELIPSLESRIQLLTLIWKKTFEMLTEEDQRKRTRERFRKAN